VTLLRRVRSLLGPEAVVEAQDDGPPRVTPRTAEACAVMLETATAEGWKVRLEGARTWSPHGALADLALSTVALDRVIAIQPADLVATVQAGITWDALRQALADQGTWLAIDPPGTGRTLGSAVATGTSGPLRSGFGSIRDHILGLTLITGDGKVVRPGGRVVKNVAGFDLTRLATGSFGAFGLITSVHLRLRSVPRADTTLIANGERDDLLEAALRMLEAGETPAALELLSPGVARRNEWTLAVRLLGSEVAVAEARRAVTAAGARALEEIAPAAAVEFWRGAAAIATAASCTLRMGALPTSLAEALDLIAHHLDDERIAVTVGAATLRWTGNATADRLKLLRHASLQHEFPVTIERAPWEILESTGHFGAYREGVSPLVDSLRKVFDPRQVLVG
jgi:glycolate oxidase FAD binding subunit